MFETQFMNASLNGWMTAMPASALNACDDAIGGEELASSETSSGVAGSDAFVACPRDAANFNVGSDVFSVQQNKSDTAELISVPDQPIHGAPVNDPLAAWMVLPSFFTLVRELVKAAWQEIWTTVPKDRVPSDKTTGPGADLQAPLLPPSALVREAQALWRDIGATSSHALVYIGGSRLESGNPARLVETMLQLAAMRDDSVPEKYRGTPSCLIRGRRDFGPDNYLTLINARASSACWQIDKIIREAAHRPAILAITEADFIEPDGPTAPLHNKLNSLLSTPPSRGNLLIITTDTPRPKL